MLCLEQALTTMMKPTNLRQTNTLNLKGMLLSQPTIIVDFHQALPL
mgnify:CR=1 FL=1